jgi:cytochrome c-type biogenesis protein CcmH/NrfG
MTTAVLYVFLIIVFVALLGTYVLRPLFTKKASTLAHQAQDDAAVQSRALKEANAAIDADLRNLVIDEAGAQARRAELLLKARAEDSKAPMEPLRDVRNAGLAIVVAMALASTVGAILYFKSEPDGLTTAKRSAPPAPGAADLSPEQIAQMVQRLDTRLNAGPPKAEDLPQWQMLARSHMMLGDADKAVKALRMVIALGGATLESELNLVEGLLVLGQGKPNDEAKKLLANAYAREPKNQRALWLNAAAAQESGDNPTAVKFLKELLPTVAPESQEAKDIGEFIQKLSR